MKRCKAYFTLTKDQHVVFKRGKIQLTIVDDIILVEKYKKNVIKKSKIYSIQNLPSKYHKNYHFVEKIIHKYREEIDLLRFIQQVNQIHDQIIQKQEMQQLDCLETWNLEFNADTDTDEDVADNEVVSGAVQDIQHIEDDQGDEDVIESNEQNKYMTKLAVFAFLRRVSKPNGRTPRMPMDPNLCAERSNR